MMMGTREEELAKVAEPPADLPEVVNDFDIEDDEVSVENRLLNYFDQEVDKMTKK